MTDHEYINDDDVKAMLDELNEAGKLPPLWQGRRPGDYVAGTLVGTQMKETPMKEFRQLITLRRPDGSLINVFIIHKVLREELAKVNPSIGDGLLIKFNGKRRSAKGREFVHYDVVLRPKQPSLDFDQGKETG